MQKCSYCGTEYPDDAVECAIDRAPLAPPAQPPGIEINPAENNVTEASENNSTQLSAADRQNLWVTAITCGTIAEADMIAARLRAAGIETFLPDECLMQVVATLGNIGNVRVQVSPKNYNAARHLIS